MKAIEAQLQDLKQQIETKPWLKWAGVAIAILLVAWAVTALDAVRVHQQKAAIAAELDLRRIMALRGQDAWLSREKLAVRLRDTLKAELPQAATTGIAQAALQNWLRDLTSGFDAEQNVTIRVNRSGPVETVPGVLRVNASLNGAFSPRQALSLLRQIETSPNLVVVETMTIQSENRSTLELGLNGYFRVDTGKSP